MFHQAIDMIGTKFGKLTAIKQVESKNRRTIWLFQCDCGGTVEIAGADVRSGNTSSCGCIKRGMRASVLLRKAIKLANRKTKRRGPPKIPMELRFHGKFKVDNDTGCWLWHGMTHCGTPYMKSLPSKINAKKYAYDFYVGPVRKSASIFNSCGNKLCVNPNHMMLLEEWKVYKKGQKEAYDPSTARLDLKGQRFGRLVPIQHGEYTKGDNKSTWVCRCDCGNYKTVRTKCLTKGVTKSCGCLQHETFGGKYVGKFRKRVLKQKGELCDICQSPRIINAHHLFSQHDHPSLRRLVCNGVPLCLDHHEGFHTIYGYGYNTPQQYMEYKEKQLCQKKPKNELQTVSLN